MRNAKLNAELSISASGRRYLAPNAVVLADIVRMRGVVVFADADMRMAYEMCTNMLRHINT